MAVTTTNIIVGPADLYAAPFDDSVVEPVDPSEALDPGWIDLGGTDDGVSLTVSQSWESHMCDQVADYIASSLTERNAKVSTNLVESTLENLQVVLNGGTITDVAAGAGTAGTSTYDPVVDLVANDPTYYSILVRGKAPNGFQRVFIIRRVLSLDDVEFSYTKAGKSMWSVTWTGHYVSQSIAPFRVRDKTAEPV